MDEKLNTSRNEDTHTFAVVTNNTYYTQNKWILKDLLDKSLKAKHGHYSLFDIQFELLGHILASQLAYQKYTRWGDRFAKVIKSFSLNKAPLERIKLAQKRLESMRNSAMAARFLSGQLRSIGDGIAWWFFNYDRAVLRLLAEHSYISIPEKGKGLYTEIYKCAELASKGKAFILNSITNFLRFGDITTYDKVTDTYKLLEIKAGEMRDSHTIRQEQNLALVQEALETGSHTMVDPDVTYTKIASKLPLLTYVKILETAMLEAKEKITSSRVFGNYLSFGICYLRKLEDIPQSQHEQLIENAISRCMSIIQKTEDLVTPTFGNISHTIHFSRVLAPYTIFPIDSDLRFSLISGDYFLLSQMNISGLARWLGHRGWEVEVLPIPKTPPNYPKSLYVPVLRIRKPRSPLVVEIPLDIIYGATMELWMPESIERMTQAILDHGYSKDSYTINFPNRGKYAWD